MDSHAASLPKQRTCPHPNHLAWFSTPRRQAPKPLDRPLPHTPVRSQAASVIVPLHAERTEGMHAHALPQYFQIKRCRKPLALS